MPTLTVITNVPAEKVPDTLEDELTDIIAQNLGKPVTYICVVIIAGQRMTFAKSKEPCASCHLESIGKIDRASNKLHTQVLMQKLNTSLGVAMDRMYLTFVDLARENVGYNGNTFA